MTIATILLKLALGAPDRGVHTYTYTYTYIYIYIYIYTYTYTHTYTCTYMYILHAAILSGHRTGECPHVLIEIYGIHIYIYIYMYIYIYT